MRLGSFLLPMSVAACECENRPSSIRHLYEIGNVPAVAILPAEKPINRSFSIHTMRASSDRYSKLSTRLSATTSEFKRSAEYPSKKLRATHAERALQSARANVRSFHKENIRSRQWQQLHELRQQKFEIQRGRFELAQTREARLATKSQNRETNAANKADSEFRSAKNANSSPQKNAPQPPSSNSKPTPPPRTAPAHTAQDEIIR